MLDSFLRLTGELHVPVLLLTLAVIIYSDHQGWLYFTGRKKILTKQFTIWSHRLVWLGLGGMIVSGISLVAPLWQFYASEPAFYIKMWFVIVLVINGYAIGSLMSVAHTRPYTDLIKAEQTKLLVSGFLSAVCWLGALVMGYFFM